MQKKITAKSFSYQINTMIPENHQQTNNNKILTYYTTTQEKSFPSRKIVFGNSSYVLFIKHVIIDNTKDT